MAGAASRPRPSGCPSRCSPDRRPAPCADDHTDHRHRSTADSSRRPASSADLERSLTQVGRAILRLEVPPGRAPRRHHHEPDGLLGPGAGGRGRGRPGCRTSPTTVELDVSTISRQVRDLVAAGLMASTPDPADGRAALLQPDRAGHGGPGGGVRVPAPRVGPGHRRLDGRGAQRAGQRPAAARRRTARHPAWRAPTTRTHDRRGDPMSIDAEPTSRAGGRPDDAPAPGRRRTPRRAGRGRPPTAAVRWWPCPTARSSSSSAG